MNKLNSYLDLKTIVYVLTTVFLIFAGWFGLKEKVAILASDLQNTKLILERQENFYLEIKKEIGSIEKTVTRIETLIEKDTRGTGITKF